jgi:hypothetical protein
LVPTDSLLDVVEVLIERSVLIDTADGLTVDPELRASVVASTPRSVLGYLHERAAAALAELAPQIAAAHLLLAARHTGHVDAELTERLATSPVITPSTAADLLLAAYQKVDDADAYRRRRWLLKAVDHLNLAGRRAQAVQVVEEELAADRGGGEYRSLLLGRLGTLHSAIRPSETMRFLRRALRQPLVPPIARGWLAAALASTAAAIGAPEHLHYHRRPSGPSRRHPVWRRRRSCALLGRPRRWRPLTCHVQPASWRRWTWETRRCAP